MRCTFFLSGEDLETLADQVVALVTLDVRDKADAARVMLVRGVVEPLLFRLIKTVSKPI